MKTVTLSKASPTPKPLKFKQVEGITFIDSGVGGTTRPDALSKLQAFWAKYPRRKLRKGEKGAAQLLKEARDRR
jgi:hypothetical protein